MGQELLTLDNMAGGAASKLVAKALDEAMANIADINTPWKARRTITLTIALSPFDEKREAADLQLACTTKLPAASGVKTSVWFGKRAGKRVAAESDPRQPGLFDEKDKPQVVPLRGAGEEKGS